MTSHTGTLLDGHLDFGIVFSKNRVEVKISISLRLCDRCGNFLGTRPHFQLYLNILYIACTIVHVPRDRSGAMTLDT